MIISWQCQQCGWMNDNNMSACRRCGGDEDARGRIKIKADSTKIAAFDAASTLKNAAKNGATYDRRK